MMHALVVLHRWLGVAFCLLFAMWFASGIVMHFVPFPSLAEAERIAGLPVIDLPAVRHGPAEAVAVSGTQRRDDEYACCNGPMGRFIWWLAPQAEPLFMPPTFRMPR